ncbi:MAG: hypothetical protein E7B67_06900 [Veillonella sp.]|nr:hypothetical protein [Veillonella sp.]
MLRKSIIMMALAATFTINVSAVQIEVPKWQPPVPGANASIPANAYENYSHINEKAIQEAEIFSAKVQKNVEKPKTAIEKVFKEKTGLAQAVKLGEFSESTVILLHEGKNNIRLSVKYIQNEGIYTYPGLENASWKIFKGKTHVMYTEFTPSKTKTTYGITYLGGGDVKDPYQDKFAEVVMSNYIIPSIEPLYGLDNYSHVKHWDNFSYRIPKKAKLVSEAMEDNKYEVRTYEDVGVKIRVLRFRIDPNIVDKSLAKKKIFTFLNKYGDLEAPTQYATVWNNGLPGFLIDRYKPNGESYLRHFTKDSEYYYSYRIDYDESKSSYKHKQLRDMVEYVDFDNVESLRKAPQWRISNSHKKKLDADPIFNPWYMEWIKILTQ